MHKEITLPKTFPVTGHTAFVGPGSIFVAIQGMKENGISYIPEALERGARHIIVQQDCALPTETMAFIQRHNAHLEVVANCRQTLAQLSAQAAGFPARDLKIIGITGTKGKTTTSFMTEWMLKQLGYKTALISTVYNRIDTTILPTNLTTPLPDYLQQFLKLCVQESVDYVVMEVAAQALSLHRIEGIEFDLISFTNFSQEHGEFYASQDEYFAAKEKIFSYRKRDCFAIINQDDAAVAQLKAAYPNIFTTGIKSSPVDMRADIKHVHPTLNGTIVVGNTSYPLAPHYGLGTFSMYNYLNAVAIGYILTGKQPFELIDAVRNFRGAPGRLQTSVMPNNARFVIDYAHNPSSFEAILSTLSSLTDHLIVIFGAGGDRDAHKRPIMGEITARYAQHIFLTTDNPRSEDALTITQAILAGIAPIDQHKVTIELDRKKAIEQAYARSQSGSIIAVLGKGPDEYQLINGKKYHFSEQDIINSLM